MTALPPLKNFIAALPEIYQPIFGHPELSQNAARDSEDRLQELMRVCHALSSELQRPLRVLDLGCAQGWFGFNLAQTGAEVVGVDYVEANINVCNMLLLENKHLKMRFHIMEIEKLPDFLQPDQFDLVLGFSVFHHLCFHNGKEKAREIVRQIFEKIPTGLVEVALDSEPYGWAPHQPKNADYLIASLPFYRVLSLHATHLSSIRRPLYFCSSRFWYLDGEIGAFTSFIDNKKGRKYFFDDARVAKLYDTGSDNAEVNRHAILQSGKFLQSPPPGYGWAPRLMQQGEANGSAWLVQEKIPGEMLSSLIAEQKFYDVRAVLLGVLQQLAVLEKSGLYHADIRTWNILLRPDGFPVLIDYNEISPTPQDCVWPDSIFLAFLIFVNEVTTRRNLEVSPTRAPFISPAHLPEPYRSWALRFWNLPVTDWSFAAMHDSLEKTTGKEPPQPETATEVWMKSIEQNLDILHGTMREMSQLVLKLHEVTMAKKSQGTDAV